MRRQNLGISLKGRNIIGKWERIVTASIADFQLSLGYYNERVITNLSTSVSAPQINPKSHKQAPPSVLINTLFNLTSRWFMFWPCTYSNPLRMSQRYFLRIQNDFCFWTKLSSSIKLFRSPWHTGLKNTIVGASTNCTWPSKGNMDLCWSFGHRSVLPFVTTLFKTILAASLLDLRLSSTPMAETPRHGDIVADRENVLQTIFV